MNESISKNMRIYYVVSFKMSTMVDTHLIFNIILALGSLPSTGEKISMREILVWFRVKYKVQVGTFIKQKGKSMSNASCEEGSRTWAGLNKQTNKHTRENFEWREAEEEDFPGLGRNPGKGKQESFVWQWMGQGDMFG